jgi:hypothetical protein
MALDLTAVNYQLDLEFPPCDHTESDIRVCKYRNAFRICYQCVTCGKRLDVLPKSAADQADMMDMPLFDDDLPRAYRQRKQARRRELIAEAKAAEKAEWARQYTLYLQSDQWKEIRQRVIRREQIYQHCEGTPLCTQCFSRPGALCHHLSYRNVGRECLVDLAWWCHTCHDSYHGIPSWPEEIA